MPTDDMRTSCNHLILLAIFIGLLCSSSSLGQTKTITGSEFYQVMADGYLKLKNTSYREKERKEEFGAGSSTPTLITERAIENIPPGKEHMISIQNEDGKIQKDERIAIGQQMYYRSNDEPWERYVNRTGAPILGEAMEPSFGSYKIIDKTKLSGQKVTIYEKTERFKKTYVDDEDSELVVRLWIDRFGRMLQVLVTMSKLESKTRIKTITTYEYDSSIKIEAPIK
ncbi:MAG: hypothetical protein ABL952_09735 [Pyrinomonadaceae bacterium]